MLLALALIACGQPPHASTGHRVCPLPDGLPPGNLLLFGEMHGSVEAPRLISEIACALSASGSVAVGLEISSEDQPLIDAFLASRGTKQDVAALTSSRFWREGKDGRSSAAMLQLIEDVRRLREEGRAIDLFAFDDQPGTDLERNVAIAQGIRRFHAAHAGTRIVALMGNIHAMQARLTIGDDTLVPSGSLLHDLEPVSIQVTYPAGTAWACMPGCGVQAIAPRGSAAGPFGFRSYAAMGGYGHSYLLPSITASPPAVSSNSSPDIER